MKVTGSIYLADLLGFGCITMVRSVTNRMGALGTYSATVIAAWHDTTGGIGPVISNRVGERWQPRSRLAKMPRSAFRRSGGPIPAAFIRPVREYTGELYIRWFQFAAFCPLFRSHGRTWHLHTPWGWNTGEAGPIESSPSPDASELHNPDVEPICQQYLNLRYQLMSYIYTMTREARDTGLPLMRALWLHYPDDALAVKRGDEYLWGRDLLVAPVVERAATSREVYLPQGDWYDWWTSERQLGQRVVTRNVDLKTMPLFVRAGAIIPFDPVRQYANEPVKAATILRIYGGADGRFVLYDDDGISQDYLQGAGSWIAFGWKDAQRKLKIEVDPRTRDKSSLPREFEIVLLPDNQHKYVSFTGEPVEVSFGTQAVPAHRLPRNKP